MTKREKMKPFGKGVHLTAEKTNKINSSTEY